MRDTDRSEKRVGLADLYGTTATISVDEDGEIRLALGIGMCEAIGQPTPEAARQIAAALLDAAEMGTSAP